jgi:hypothetical protein
MKIKDLSKFKQIYKEIFDVDIDEQTAQKLADRLVELAEETYQIIEY